MKFFTVICTVLYGNLEFSLTGFVLPEVNCKFNTLHISKHLFTTASSASSFHGQEQFILKKKTVKYYIPSIDSRQIPIKQATMDASNLVTENTKLIKTSVSFQFLYYKLYLLLKWPQSISIKWTFMKTSFISRILLYPKRAFEIITPATLGKLFLNRK